VSRKKSVRDEWRAFQKLQAKLAVEDAERLSTVKARVAALESMRSLGQVESQEPVFCDHGFDVSREKCWRICQCLHRCHQHLERARYAWSTATRLTRWACKQANCRCQKFVLAVKPRLTLLRLEDKRR
jgi:hypothetical protein